MKFNKNLKNLAKICHRKKAYKKRVEELDNFLINQYPVVDMLLEERFKNETVENLGLDENMRLCLTAIFDTVIRGKDCIDFFKNLDDSYEKKIDGLVVIIYNYALNKISFDDIKYSLYLMLFNIDYLDFVGISMTATLCLLELFNRGVDISLLAGCGNFYIQFMQEVATGKFEDVEYAKFRGNLVLSIDDCLITGEDMMITFDNGKELFFEKAEDDIVLIFESDNLKQPIAIINNDNEFLIGSFNVFDKYYNKKESNEKEYDGIDDIINFYNNMNNS